MLTTCIITRAGSAPAGRPGAPVVRPEGPVASRAGDARPGGSRHDANDRATVRGLRPLGDAFEAKRNARPGAHSYARKDSAGERDRAS